MYKSDLKDIVAGDTVVLHSEFRGYVLVKVDRVLKKEIITSENNHYDKNGYGITYKEQTIYAPLATIRFTYMTALEKHEEWKKQTIRNELIEAFDLYEISTDFIQKILVMLKEEKEKHV